MSFFTQFPLTGNDQREFISSDIADVMQKYEFAFDLMEFRKVIEGQLIRVYSLEPLDRYIRRVMLETLRLAETKITAMKRSPFVSLIWLRLKGCALRSET